MWSHYFVYDVYKKYMTTNVHNKNMGNFRKKLKAIFQSWIFEKNLKISRKTKTYYTIFKDKPCVNYTKYVKHRNSLTERLAPNIKRPELAVDSEEIRSFFANVEVVFRDYNSNLNCT